MGLYDRVIYPGKCEGCGRRVTEFQTKDTKNPALIRVSLRRINEFYTFCYCGTEIIYARYSNTEFAPAYIHPVEYRKRHGHAQPEGPNG